MLGALVTESHGDTHRQHTLCSISNEREETKTANACLLWITGERTVVRCCRVFGRIGRFGGKTYKLIYYFFRFSQSSHTHTHTEDYMTWYTETVYRRYGVIGSVVVIHVKLLVA